MKATSIINRHTVIADPPLAKFLFADTRLAIVWLIVRVYVGYSWLEAGWHGKPEMFEVRDNFVTTDRKRVGVAADGFRLPKDSPAWGLGFRPIPFDRIGPRPDADRKRLARFK